MFATAFPDDHFRILVSFDVNMQCESPVAPMTYPATVQFLYGLQLHGIKLGLETIRTLLARVGDPHRQYPVLHIGGTNGKGSTAAMTPRFCRPPAIGWDCIPRRI